MRKQLKAARATLRLLRGSLSERAYRALHRLLRDAARQLQTARDDTVLVGTLDALMAELVREIGRGPLAAFEAQLRRGATRSGAWTRREGLCRAAAKLRGAQSRLHGCSNSAEGWGAVRRSLTDSYRRARKAARGNARQADGRSLHEWRKRTKSLHSQLLVIAPMQHASLIRLASRLHRLANRLGEEHDLAVLSERAGGSLEEDASSVLQRVIARRRASLQRKALALGVRAYAEKPTHFGRRLRRYFRRSPD